MTIGIWYAISIIDDFSRLTIYIFDCHLFKLKSNLSFQFCHHPSSQKLGRGGSEGCFVPQQIERLNDVGVIQIECGAQFSLALTSAGEIWTWGKVVTLNLIARNHVK